MDDYTCADPAPITPIEMVNLHTRKALYWMVLAMPEDGLEKMTKRLIEIKEHYEKH